MTRSTAGAQEEAVGQVCGSCGSALVDGARFCESCGAPQGPGTEHAAPDGERIEGTDRGLPSDAAAELALSTGLGLGGAPAATVDGQESPIGFDPSARTTPGERAAAAVLASPGPAAPCASCGGVVAADGYCETCGARGVLPRDHFEDQPAAWLGGVCDRGVRHDRNEDAMALAADGGGAEGGADDTGSSGARGGADDTRGSGSAYRRGVVVVCDGVSSSTDSDVASLAAARAACEVLRSSRSRGVAPVAAPSTDGRDTAGTAATPGGAQRTTVAALASRLARAAEAAEAAVVRSTRRSSAGASAVADENTANPAGRSSASPASCTFVAAVVEDRLAVVAWIGDSRAYWLPDQGTPRLLTVDDSWAADQIAAGASRAEAETGAQAHAITRWLGVDSPGGPPRTQALDLDSAGWLLVCSDGLWNYCSEAADLATLVAATAATVEGAGTPRGLAGALVDWANAQGGKDNVTVALARTD